MRDKHFILILSSLSSAIFIISISFFSYAQPPNNVSEECRRYDLQRNLIEKDYYRQNGSLQQCRKYDIDGNIIEESFYDEDGTLGKNPVDNWSAKRCKYRGGKLVEQIYYDEEGHPQERKIYNERAELVDRKYYGDGSNIDPSEEFNPHPMLGREREEYYDAYGRPQGETNVIREVW